jgi:DNA-directed RNA polymerase II subunit RPB2
MTVGQLVECALGKDCALTGRYGDATPFTENSANVADKLVKEIHERMEKTGFSSHGWETMYNPLTGEQIESRIFIGPTYYQRLKHMVDDKMHARAKGHVTTLTRQPLEGRSRDGGLRFGIHFAKQSKRNLWLVRGVAGDKFKLRETPKICV